MCGFATLILLPYIHLLITFNLYFMPELIELKAVRTWENRMAVTTIYKNNEKFAVFPAGSKQPREGQKTIIINCWKWKLNWI